MLGATAWSASAVLAQTATQTQTATPALNATQAQSQLQPNHFGGGGGGQGGGGSTTQKATDPGVRGGPPGAGGPLPGLSQNELNFFNAATAVFNEVEEVPNGLGPRFNLDSCAGCHAAPASGGSSPATNPEVAIATANGAKNTLPSFITANGPTREARFVRNSNGTPDGSVHDLFVITGRSDAPGCNIQQPNFAAAVASNNVIFRIPTPTYGLGLVEATPDSALQAAFAANAQQKSSLGISGSFNTNTNDQTITRFGWKAQNKSLIIFAAEAYNVEEGITNDAFPNERENDPNCQFNPLPESTTNLVNTTNSGSPAADFSQDIVNFSAFMRLLAPPTPASGTPATATATATATAGSSTSTAATTPTTTSTASTTTGSTATLATQLASAAADTSVLAAASGAATTSAAPATSSAAATSSATVARGQQVFSNIGCAACHTPSLTTGKTVMTGQSNVTYQPLSDFAVHTMGTGLADGVTQGNATGNQFRTAPLWGVGQRLFFLHDGRTNDLMVAVQQHSSNGSEANTVVRNFNMLSVSDQQSLLNYLRSL
jgi:CxxC motif-containing protein (DUF1111 family)